MDEIWRDIPGFEGAYQASSLGRIRSLDRVQERVSKRIGNYKVNLKGQILKPSVNKDGYESVRLKGKKYDVHVLIAITFIGIRPTKQDIRHLDGNPQNNRVDNLAYGTRKQNILDVFRNGEKWKTFDLATVNRIRQILDTGLMTLAEIARAFQVSPRTISNIRDGRTFEWKE